MTLRTKPYLETKNSGTDWLGDIPEHWGVRRLDAVAELRVSNVDKHSKDREIPVRLCNYVDVYYHDRIHSKIPFMAATATPEEVQRFRLRRKDVLITKDSETWDDIGVPALVADEVGPEVVSGYHLALLRPNEPLMDGAYLFRALQTRSIAAQLHVRANGVTRYGLSHNAIKSVLVPLPLLSEQAAIARFLDHMDRPIQKHIRAKEKLIALLDEYKQALIHQAVTGQIDVHTGQPYPAYKASGVPWLGDVPEHWEVKKLRQCGMIAGGMTPSMENRRFWDGSISWVTPKDMKREAICDSGMKVTEAAVHETSLRLIDPPAVLMVVRGMILARRVPIAWTTSPVTINQDMKSLMPVSGIKAEFLARALDSAQDAFVSLIDEAGHGTRRLPTERWRALAVAIPPEDEQGLIVDFLRRSTHNVAAAIDSARELVTRLNEFRTRLIADVVTGKLDVREAAAALPEINPLAAEDTLDGTLDTDAV